MTPVIVLTTVGSSFDARALARELVEQRLVACVNIVERVTSIYRWKETVEEDGEQLLVMKTTRERIDELQKALFARHPYEVPELVVIPIESLSGPYREWLEEAVAPLSS
ncbi:MAG: divalent-cation tolerance protein CutA [Thermoanaerobaculia bacterium]|nr:divalent-cation tolerance protein CutA [Thermoanaerobaculia bacterium]